jgi:serine/threonine protein kinase
MICLGQGSNGKVHSSKNNLNAIKTIKCCPCKKIYREIYFSKNLNHPNIIQSSHISMHENIVQITFPRKRMNLQMFLHKYFTLNDKKPIPTFLARGFMIQILEIFSFLHFQNIVHRDFKLDNILIGDYPESYEDIISSIDRNKIPKIYLTDFGTMKFVNAIQPQTFSFLTDRMCSLWLQSPEMLNFLKISKHDSYAVDMWCIGCVLYALYSGMYPYTGENRKEMRDSIANVTLNYNVCSEESAFIIKGCLQKEPEKRLKISDLFVQNILSVKEVKDKNDVEYEIKGNIKAFLKSIILNLCKYEEPEYIYEKTLYLLGKYVKQKTDEKYNYYELSCLSLAFDLVSCQNVSVEEIKNFSLFYKNKINSKTINDYKKILCHAT